MEENKIYEIVKENPNKDKIKFGLEQNVRLEHCITGSNLDDFFKRDEYFENEQIFKERKKTTSNKDLFSRLLQKESMVFNARGGSSIYDGLNEKQSSDLNEYINNVRGGMSLRKWVQTFANKAYEVDPMALVFIEKDGEGNPYPTYKSIKTVYDYSVVGSTVEYVCFKLSKDDVEQLQKRYVWQSKINATYFRFVDSEYDYIIELVQKENPVILDQMTIKHGFFQCPAIVVSDIPFFKDVNCKLSKLDNVVELAEQYQKDRSVRDLSKKLHGFPKHYEPTVTCPKCKDGYIGDEVCHYCNGTGRKSITNVADKISIPLDMLAQNTSLDVKNIYGYVTPDILTWNKQDDSLSDLENLISDGFWGSDNRKYSTGANLNSSLQETATKTMANLQPIYARLERTAEWAEELEGKIIEFIGKLMYDSLKNVTVKYGRSYILESTEELYTKYLDFKQKNSPQFVLNDYLDRYLRSLYQNNPVEMSLAIKMIEVEPFIHYSLNECIANGISGDDLLMKKYFSQWYNSANNDFLFVSNAEKLRADLLKYSKQKETVSDVPPLN